MRLVQRKRPAEALNFQQSPDLVDRDPARALAAPSWHFAGDERYAPHSNGSFAMRYWSVLKASLRIVCQREKEQSRAPADRIQLTLDARLYYSLALPDVQPPT
jgi:hypothetical protein